VVNSPVELMVATDVLEEDQVMGLARTFPEASRACAVNWKVRPEEPKVGGTSLVITTDATTGSGGVPSPPPPPHADAATRATTTAAATAMRRAGIDEA
jgi:hypothetical protein